MAIELTLLDGRYPLNLARYDPTNIRARLERIGSRVVVRLEDTFNVDRWEELEADVEALLTDLERGGGGELQLPLPDALDRR